MKQQSIVVEIPASKVGNANFVQSMMAGKKAPRGITILVKGDTITEQYLYTAHDKQLAPITGGTNHYAALKQSLSTVPEAERQYGTRQYPVQFFHVREAQDMVAEGVRVARERRDKTTYILVEGELYVLSLKDKTVQSITGGTSWLADLKVALKQELS